MLNLTFPSGFRSFLKHLDEKLGKEPNLADPSCLLDSLPGPSFLELVYVSLLFFARTDVCYTKHMIAAIVKVKSYASHHCIYYVVQA